jgi:Spy/CpxP family protein refolding chaperone
VPRRRAVVAALFLAGALPLAGCCASGRRASAKPARPDPAEEVLAALTQALKLDPGQQQRTRELLKQLADRDDRMHADWAAGKKVEPQAALASRAQFERDFAAILTPEQQRVFRETRSRLILQTRSGGPS